MENGHYAYACVEFFGGNLQGTVGLSLKTFPCEIAHTIVIIDRNDYWVVQVLYQEHKGG